MVQPQLDGYWAPVIIQPHDSRNPAPSPAARAPVSQPLGTSNRQAPFPLSRARNMSASVLVDPKRHVDVVPDRQVDHPLPQLAENAAMEVGVDRIPGYPQPKQR